MLDVWFDVFDLVCNLFFDFWCDVFDLNIYECIYVYIGLFKFFIIKFDIFCFILYINI